MTSDQANKQAREGGSAALTSDSTVYCMHKLEYRGQIIQPINYQVS